MASKAVVKAKPLEEHTEQELLKLAGAGNQQANKLLFARMEATGRIDIVIDSMTRIQDRVLGAAHVHLFDREIWKRKLNKMRAELGYETGTPLERLLIDRIVMCWYHVSSAEANYAKKLNEGVSLAHGTYLQKTINRSEARYQAAIKSLAVVRRLEVPHVQVNIGEKQINIMQGVGEQVKEEVREDNETYDDNNVKKSYI